jgi:hypothetical protein
VRRTLKAPSTTVAASTGTTRARRTMFGLACLCVLGLAAFLGSGAPSVGAAESFPGQGFLPDNRAWEMVSPPDKSGGDVTPVSANTRAAADGSAVGFTSLVGFGDTQGAALGVEYIAERTAAPGTPGWATHGITPALKATTSLGQLFGSDPAYEGEMSPDLSRGVFRAFRPLGEAPNVAELQNLYVRDDLRTPGPGSYRLMSEGDIHVDLAKIFGPFSSFVFVRPTLAGASADFSKIVFETGFDGGLSPALKLTSEGEENFQTKLYESDQGDLRLAGRIPPLGEVECDDETASPCEAAPSSRAGQGAAGEGGRLHYTPHMISADGRRVFFQAPIGSGNVYMREDGHRTVQLNVSEKTVPEAPQGAQLFDASADGSRVFFTTGERLVDGDEDNGSDIYMAEPDAPAGQRLTLVTVDGEPVVDDSVTDVIGASDDGHYLYFTMSGQLVAGDPNSFSGGGLFLWHEGTVTYIGEFADVGDTGFLGLGSATWFFNSAAKNTRLTPDGRHLIFRAADDAGFEGRGGLVGYEQQGEEELYLYDADTGKLRCATCNPSGTPASTDAFINTREESSNLTKNSHLSQPLSADGRYVFFNTAEALVPEDTNGVVDPYEYDAQSEEVHLLSSGEDPAPSFFLDASADGKNVFIDTRERLSGWDVDTSRDLYDARVNGGLPEPRPAPPSCQGDACQPAPLNLNDPTPASSGYAGPHNPSGHGTARCSKGRHRARVKGKSRCVKAKQSHKRAKHERRAGK